MPKSNFLLGFLIRLATQESLRKKYEQAPTKVMEEQGLTRKERTAIRSGSDSQIARLVGNRLSVMVQHLRQKNKTRKKRAKKKASRTRATKGRKTTKKASRKRATKKATKEKSS